MDRVRGVRRELQAKLARVARWERSHSLPGGGLSTDFTDEDDWNDGEVVVL